LISLYGRGIRVIFKLTIDDEGSLLVVITVRVS